MSCKKYVEVTARFDVDGTVFPLEIHWEDGAKILRLTGFSISAGRPASRQEERESGIPAGFEAGKNILWLEETRWFIEAKESD